jgi:thymidylate synthase (FAD)
MVEIKFMVQVPMDCWRQWIRHRTANVNEYSTRYTEAIDMCQTTQPDQWRLQATDNKQGSDGFLKEDIGKALTATEFDIQQDMIGLYKQRIRYGVAKEQARKDLPLSTYTRAYWKCDLHNIFNFLRLRMDSHAQYEIRMYANAMYEIVKQIVPVACEAFEDFVLNACKFSAVEMMCIRGLANNNQEAYEGTQQDLTRWVKPDRMSDREWKNFLKKVGVQ